MARFRCGLSLLLVVFVIAAWTPMAFPQVAPAVAGQVAKRERPPARVWPDTRVGVLLKELDDLQKSRQLGEDPWARKLKEIVDVGPPAVPELIAALDATHPADRLMMRTLPYLLRGIGDKRAIPALIRAIPRCFGRDGSTAGYRSKDPELMAFLMRNDAMAHRRPPGAPLDEHYVYGRPVDEIFGTLEKWTKVEQGWLEISAIDDGPSSTPRQRWLKQKLYLQCAESWADWWSKHWSEHVDDAEWSKVDLQHEPLVEPPSPILDLNLRLRHGGGHSNCFAEPATNRQAEDIFLDLDTGRSSGLPPEWRTKSPGEIRSGEEALVDWAREQGFDLMGVERTVDGKPQLLIRTIQLDIWEVPATAWDHEIERTAQQHIDSGRWVGKDVVHVNADSGAAEPDAPGIFFYVTIEGTPGLFHLGVPVFEARQTPDGGTKDLELRSTGETRGRRYGTRALSPGQ